MVVTKNKSAVKNDAPVNSESTEAELSVHSSRSTKSPGRRKSPSRSPARKGSPGRPRTVNRAAKSPARAKKESPPPLRSSTPKVELPKARSPIRKSPSRKSPTRTRAAPKSAETYLSERVQRPRRTKLDIDSDSDTPDGDLLSEKLRAAGKGRSRRLEVQVEKLNLVASESSKSGGFNIIKRVTQNSQNRDVERVVHLKHFDNLAQKLGEFSDEDDTTQVRKSISIERTADFKQITEFGGIWGALFFTIFTPSAVILFLMSCDEYQCSFTKIPNYSKYLSFSAFFDLASLLGYTGFAVALATLSVIPFGGIQVQGIPTKQGKLTYMMNGLFSFVVLTAVLFGLEFKNIPITEFIIKHLFHLLIASILVGFFITSYAFIRSFYVPLSSLNVHVIGKNKLYAFFMGRELNPRAFGLLDLKLYVTRMALTGCMLLDFVYLYRSISWTTLSSNNVELKSLNFNPTLITLVIIHTIYYIDALIYEAGLVTTFEFLYEGFGFMGGVGYLIYPFMMIPVTKYVIDYDIRFPLWKLACILIIFSFGYILYRGSNNQKNAFRKNPYDPALSHLETIPTTKGKKLICSGFWGVVRHPNYLGDILMNLCFIPFAYNVPPVLTALSIVLLLVHRSVRDNIRCREKYGPAWDRYCNKVKYVLLPKIY